MTEKLTHLDDQGRGRMVDVADKPETVRIAVATGSVSMKHETLDIVLSGKAKKGDVLTIAELAGIMGAKHTATLIPLCHPLSLSSAYAVLETDPDLPGVRVRVTVKTTSRTGVEMEALTGVSIACLTVYDMLKSADRDMVISDICLFEKSGGKSGSYKRGG